MSLCIIVRGVLAVRGLRTILKGGNGMNKQEIKDMIRVMFEGYKNNTGYYPKYLIVGSEAYDQLVSIWLDQMVTNEVMPSRVLGMIVVKCPSFTGGYMVGE
jgi:hypothetical protein